jgi:hypothetical protein
MLTANAALADWSSNPGAVSAPSSNGPFATSDVARLRRVIMCPPSTGVMAPGSYRDDVMHMADHDTDAMVSQHA